MAPSVGRSTKNKVAQLQPQKDSFHNYTFGSVNQMVSYCKIVVQMFNLQFILCKGWI